MHHLINSMAELSKYHLSVLIDELLTWRASLTSDVTKAYVAVTFSSAILGSNLLCRESNSQKVKSTKETLLVEERNKVR